jgi:integrase
MSLSAAGDEIRDRKKDVANGIDPRRAKKRRRAPVSPLPGGAAIASESARHTVEFLASDFMENRIKPRHKDPAWTQRVLDVDILPVWRGRDARTIELPDVHDVLDPVLARGSNSMAQKVAGVVMHMFKWGANRGIVKTSPVLLLDTSLIGTPETPRKRTWSATETRIFLRDPRAATRFWRLTHLLMALLLTGVRRGELAKATWSEFDWIAKVWHIPAAHSKNGLAFDVPLSDWAINELRALKGLSNYSKWVLPNKDDTGHIHPKQITRGVAKCLKRFAAVGIDAFTPHDLRRTFRKGIRKKCKVAKHIAEACLNHKQTKLEDTYDTPEPDLYIDERREALDKWAAYLTKLKASDLATPADEVTL